MLQRSLGEAEEAEHLHRKRRVEKNTVIFHSEMNAAAPV